MVGQKCAVHKASLEEDLVRRVLLNRVDDFVVLLRIAELHVRTLVTEHGVEGVELAEDGEDVVDRCKSWGQLAMS